MPSRCPVLDQYHCALPLGNLSLADGSEAELSADVHFTGLPAFELPATDIRSQPFSGETIRTSGAGWTLTASFHVEQTPTSRNTLPGPLPITIPESARLIDATLVLEADRTLAIRDISLRLALPAGLGGPDFSWLPTLKHNPEDIAGAHVFRSPCVAVRAGSTMAALLPRPPVVTPGRITGFELGSGADIDPTGTTILPAIRPRPWLDLSGPSGIIADAEFHHVVSRPGRATRPARADVLRTQTGTTTMLVYGLGYHEPYGHVYYRHTGRAMRLEADAGLALRALVYLDTRATRESPGLLPRLSWELARQDGQLGRDAGQALSFEDYTREAFTYLLDRRLLWRGFSLGGRDCGGLCVRLVRHGLDRGGVALPEDITPKVALNYLLTPTLSLRNKLALAQADARGLGEHIWNGLFFNEVRTAFGMAYFGGLTSAEGRTANSHPQSADLQDNARAIRELALAAPAADGIFPSVLASPGTADRPPRWVPGTRVWRYVTQWSLIDASWTATWLLLSWLHIETDPRLLARCQSFAEFLLDIQAPSGAFPCWAKMVTGAPIHGSPVQAGEQGRPARPFQPAGALQESAASALPAAFLASLAEAIGERRFLDAAARTGAFLERTALSTGEWLDPEVFFSCSPKTINWRDSHSGVPLAGSLALSWASELFLRLAEGTGDARWTADGQEALDRLLLFQQAWSPPWIGFDARGGFGAINTDSEWSDARQAQFATLLMDWYTHTGEAQLFDRGIAALRAAFTLMHHPAHRAGAPGNNAFAGDEDRGAIPENYGHAGRDAKITGYLMPDWGAGSASSSAALARIRYGDVFIDAGRGRAFGINRCTVRARLITPDRIELELDRDKAGRGASDAGPVDSTVAGSLSRRLRLVATGIASTGATMLVDGVETGHYTRELFAHGILV